MKALAKKLLGIWILSFLGLGVISTLTYAQESFSQVGFWDTTAVGNVGVGGTSSSAGDSTLITVIKSFINWTLWMLALITLVILLWGGFQMVTAAGDDAKYKKWFTILKQAGVWLAFIALSWLVVSLIFFIINGIWAKTA